MQTPKNILLTILHDRNAKIRISISKSERIVEEKRKKKLRNKPLSVEEKIMEHSPFFGD